MSKIAGFVVGVLLGLLIAPRESMAVMKSETVYVCVPAGSVTAAGETTEFEECGWVTYYSEGGGGGGYPSPGDGGGGSGSGDSAADGLGDYPEPVAIFGVEGCPADSVNRESLVTGQYRQFLYTHVGASGIAQIRKDREFQDEGATFEGFFWMEDGSGSMGLYQRNDAPFGSSLLFTEVIAPEACS